MLMESAIRLNPRAPLVLVTHELDRRPGSMITVVRDVVAPADLGTDVIGVSEGSDLHLDLRLESVMEGVLVTGSVSGRATGECIRCLTGVEQGVEVWLTELFAYPGAQVEHDPDHHHDVVDPRWAALQGLALDEGQPTNEVSAPTGARADAQEEN